MSAAAETDRERPLRVAYVVSRFPSLTETFVLRELQAVDADPRVEVALVSLFRPLDATVHPAAEPWIARRHRPSARQVVAAAGWWAVRRPLRSGAILVRTVRDHGRRPRVLAKALATTVVATALARHVARERIDHLHAHFATMPAQAAWTVARLTGVGYSVTAHAHDVFIHRLGLRTRLGDAAFVVAISDFHRTLLTEAGSDPDRTPTVRMGIDPRAYPYRPRVRPEGEPPHVVLVSSFREYKGHRFLIEAIAGDPALRDVTVELIGTGELEPEVRAQVTGAGLDGRVRFAGPLPETAVRERLRHADVLVQPSVIARNGDTEGLPTTLVEAAACGVTLVATRVAGVPDLVRDGVTGMLAEPGDVAGLADALRRAIDADSATVERIRRAARQRVESHHDGDRNARELVDWFVRAGDG
ncbi:MAG: glycosyltransferase [Patulibacter sp.]